MKRAVLSIITVLALAVSLSAQNVPGTGPTTVPVQSGTPYYSLVPTSATAAVNNQTTLTIAAPTAGLSIYVCSLSFLAAQDATSGANTNLATTSTNFNSFALTYSLGATANATYLWLQTFGASGTGCVKAAQPGVAVTFVSPSAQTHTAFTWTATYYVAP